MAKKKPTTPGPPPAERGDLQRSFPGLGGFSRTNVYRMRAFSLAYQDSGQGVPQAVGRPTEAKGQR
jgi:hypothetical protein